MQEIDRQANIRRYEDRLARFGYSPQTLGWGKHGRQAVRFDALGAGALAEPGRSVLDVGCGFADLYDYLRGRGWQGDYCGVDIVPGLLEMARVRHPGLDLREADITARDPGLPVSDYVIASGVFNARLHTGDNRRFTELALRRMFGLARAAVCVDFLSTYVDFQHPDAWHTDPAWALDFARQLSRRVMLRHDYMPYEFALIIYCDDSISSRNVFKAVEKNHD